MNRNAHNILVINPPVVLGARSIDYPHWYGLGAVSVAAALRAAGFRVRLADAMALPASRAAALLHGGVLAGCRTRELLRSISGPAPRTVILSVPPFLMPHARTPFTQSLIAEVRSAFPGSHLIAADCYFSGMHYLEYDGGEFLSRNPGADAVVKYECEAELPVLLDLPRKRRARVTLCRAANVSPDALPVPAWDLISIEDYFAFQQRFFKAGRAAAAGPPRTLPAVTSRGCAFACTFCTANPGQDQPLWRAHSPEYLDGLFRAYAHDFGARCAAVLDGAANIDRARFTALLDILRTHGLACEFPNGLRADRLTRTHLKKIRALGGGLKISAESADPRTLQALGKKLDPGAAERVAAWCRELGIALRIHYMIGLPGDDMESVNRTLLHAARMRDQYGALPLVQNAVPLPGARLARAPHTPAAPRRFYDSFTAGHAPLADPCVAAPLRRARALFTRRMALSDTEKIIINLTYRCSNNCRFCAAGDKNKQHGDFERYRGLLRQYRARGVRLTDFDGGEPTLYPHLFDLIQEARDLGYEQISVTTNGRILADRSYASRFLLSGVTSALVSLHGNTAALHEYFTRRKGSFRETVEGIRNLVELRPGRVALGVNTIVAARNAPHLEAFLEFVKSMGIPRVNIQFLTPFGAAAAYQPGAMNTLLAHAARAYAAFKDQLDVNIVNITPCHAARIDPHLRVDTGKYARDMVFVDAPPQNLARYLAARRRKTAECAACPSSIVCEGFYTFDA